MNNQRPLLTMSATMNTLVDQKTFAVHAWEEKAVMKDQTGLDATDAQEDITRVACLKMLHKSL